jgi:hypothetical protein
MESTYGDALTALGFIGFGVAARLVAAGSVANVGVTPGTGARERKHEQGHQETGRSLMAFRFQGVGLRNSTGVT